MDNIFKRVSSNEKNYDTIKKIIKSALITILACVLIVSAFIYLRYFKHYKNNSEWEHLLAVRNIESYQDEYYYNRYSEDKQIVYRNIIDSVTESSKFEDKIKLPKILPNAIVMVRKEGDIKSADDVFDIMYSIDCDMPELIWLGKYKVIDTRNTMYMLFFYNEQLDTTKEVYKGYEEIDKYMDDIIEPLISENKSLIQTELDIFQAITSTMIRDYKKEGNAYSSIYGLVSDRKVVCSGTSKTLKYIDKKYNVGLDVVNVTGNLVTPDSNEKHMWCTVKINGECTIVDIVNCFNLLSHNKCTMYGIYYEAEGNIEEERII